jgi:hypothetical protein
MPLFTVDDIGDSQPVEGNAFVRAFPVVLPDGGSGRALLDVMQLRQLGVEPDLFPQWIVDGAVIADLMTGRHEIRTPASSAEAATWLAVQGRHS